MPDLSAKEERKRQPAKVHALPVPLRKKPVAALPGYAELHCLTNFSFQRGASTPEEVVERAYQLGYAALARTPTSRRSRATSISACSSAASSASSASSSW
jgi:error-prone DNA polymerase